MTKTSKSKQDGSILARLGSKSADPKSLQPKAKTKPASRVEKRSGGLAGSTPSGAAKDAHASKKTLLAREAIDPSSISVTITQTPNPTSTLTAALRNRTEWIEKIRGKSVLLVAAMRAPQLLAAQHPNRYARPAAETVPEQKKSLLQNTLPPVVYHGGMPAVHVPIYPAVSYAYSAASGPTSNPSPIIRHDPITLEVSGIHEGNTMESIEPLFLHYGQCSVQLVLNSRKQFAGVVRVVYPVRQNGLNALRELHGQSADGKPYITDSDPGQEAC
ncbi:hypothetical protein HDU91_001891 [Kappamyces sp. JEL0680]|nr:hypothetical protein HDU91_001891 [Kappamyces sp. JEL0680]